MLYPARMLFATIGVHRKYVYPLLESLHEAGLLEIRSVHEGPGENAPALVPGERGTRLSMLVDLRMQIDRILSAFERVNPRERSLLHEMLGTGSPLPQPVPELPAERLKEQIEPLLRRGERAFQLSQEISSLEERREMLERERKGAELMMPFGIDTRHMGTSAYLYLTAGVLPRSEAPSLLEAISGLGRDRVLVYSSTTGETTTLLIAAEVSLQQELERRLRTVMWEPIQLPRLEGSPQEILLRNAEELQGTRERISRLRMEMEALSHEIGPTLRGYMEDVEIRLKEEEALALTGLSREMVVIEGYLRESDRTELERLVNVVTNECAFCRFQMNENAMREVPTAYQHPRWLRPFEMLTTMFAVPKYTEIDPTILIAPLIVGYFGLMLGDAGYGMVIAILAVFALLRFGRWNPMLRDLSFILLLCGISGVVFGMLQGGFFGDLLPRFFGIVVPFMVIDPLADPVTILIVALAIGLIQINAGLMLGTLQHLREGLIREAITDRAVWFILQPAALVFVLGFFGWYRFSTPVQLTSLIGLLLGLGLLVYGHGPLAFFRITNFLGDWLSYTRILALDLATLGIAMTINILAGMIASLHPYVIPIGVIFAIAGHIFNLILQTLGGMIHALRLQYVEFFGKFYTGGGRTFTPFHSARRFSYRIKEVAND
ncbi:MAG: V-type ATP synthase subunit I [Methanomicrobiales archaeon]|nr:V-type ATP synthase subunit I [Methanomicrobiales archaeon]